MVADHLLALFGDGGVRGLRGEFVWGKIAGEEVCGEEMGTEYVEFYHRLSELFLRKI